MNIYKIPGYLLIFLLLFIGFFHPITAMSQDLGRHFLLGDIILKTFNIPKINLFSYTYPNFPFINLHWLSEVILFLIFKTIGFNGLLLFSTLIVIAAFFLITFKAAKTSNPSALILGAILYLIILFERTDIRPEIFSFLFLSIFIFILYKYRDKFTGWIFLIPVIELFWVNMHIYFIVGIAVLFLFLIESILLNRKKIFVKKTKVLFLVFILSVISTLINPNGLKGAIYPLIFQQNYGYTIIENQSIFYIWQYAHTLQIIIFSLTSLILMLSFLLIYKKTRIIDLLLSSLFIYLAISAIRNFPLFVFGTFIAFTHNASFFFNKFSLKTQKITYLLLLAIIIILIFQIPQSKGFGFGINEEGKKGMDFYLKNNIQGPIFNNFDIGSYLDYRLYPKQKVFVDSRPGEYPVDFFQKVYIPMQIEKNVFTKIDNKYNFNSIIFSHNDMTEWSSIFLANISNNPNWKMVYLDDFLVIFVKNNKQNKELIQKFSINESNFNLINYNLKNKNVLIRLVRFTEKIGWEKKSLELYGKLLNLEPNNCLALYKIAEIYNKNSNPASNIFYNRFVNNCK